MPNQSPIPRIATPGDAVYAAVKLAVDRLRNSRVAGMTEAQLEGMLPSLGMNDEELLEMPRELAPHFGKGLRFWQYPNQFAKYLALLAAWDIRHYLEIGARWGGTFIITLETIRQRFPEARAYCCDIIPQSPILEAYSRLGTNWTYIQHGSPHPEIPKCTGHPIDLVLIDGEHTYDACKRDFEMALSLSARYVVIHDIVNERCPGVQRLWRELRLTYGHRELTDQYDSVDGQYLGIGILMTG